MDGRILPGKREVNDSGRNLEILGWRKFAKCGLNRGKKSTLRKLAPIEVKLKGAHTRGEIDHTFEPFLFEPCLEGMHPQSLFQIEEIRTELDQEVPIAGGAHHHLSRTSHLGPQKDSISDPSESLRTEGGTHRRGGQLADHLVLLPLRRDRCLER
jgi:hypothetical protein